MVVFEHFNVIVTKGFGVLDADEEVVVDSRVSDVVEEATQEARHHLQVRNVLHDLSMLDEVVKVASGFNNSKHVVILAGFVRLMANLAQQVLEVLLGDRELF